MKKDISRILKSVELSADLVLMGTKAIVTAVAPDYEYVGGTRTGKILGTRYTVVCPKADYCKIVVKVAGEAIISQEDISTSATAIWMSFEGFIGRFYVMDGEIGISCRAAKAVLVKGKGEPA